MMAAHVLMALQIAEELEAQLQMQFLQIQRRNLRDESSPFEISESFFKKLYRLPKHVTLNLIAEIEPFMQEQSRVSAIPNHLKVLCALNFYAHGSYQKSVGQDFNLALSQTSVSGCIEQVSDVITQHLSGRYIRFPVTAVEMQNVKRGYMEKFNFPGVIGCIDGTHIAIVAPPIEHPQHPGYAYLNRKGFSSINVQIICDSDLQIISCDARYPGSTHDAAIWNMSRINRELTEKFNNDERGFWLLGDSGYPLQPWLLTPIEGADEGTPEARYTSTHVSTRNVVERCNGVLKMRFRCLLKHRVLHYSPVWAAKIIYSCCVLHKLFFMRSLNIDEEEPMNLCDDLMENPEQNPQEAGDRNLLTIGRRVRAQVIRNHFNI